jgi:hypothetical protein
MEGLASELRLTIIGISCKPEATRLVSPAMPEDLLRYDVLAQEALRGLVRKVLAEVAQTGLPGEHHFFITFDTNHPGARISSRLKAQYPEEMTVVLQHQFWDLTVTDTGFEVGLSFKGVPEKLVVPLHAISGFVDPHAGFALKFDPARDAATVPKELSAPGKELPAPKQQAKPKLPPAETKAPAATPEGGTADVVSIDAFRKKNG